MTMRLPEKFTSIGGDIEYAFNTALLEAQFEQGLRTPTSLGQGADYAHDHLGYGVSPKNPGSIGIRCLAVESSPTNLATEVDEARAECLRIGKGYLYRIEADGSTRRRCLARLTSMPSMTIEGRWLFGASPQTFQFMQLSDWMATSAESASQTITASPTLVTITNPGNLDCLDVTFTVTALAASGFSAPSIRNLTTGERVYSTRVAGSDEEVWRVRTAAWAVEFDGSPGFEVGYSYVGQGGVGPVDYENDFSLAAVEGGMLRLKPGVNQLQVEGLTNATFASEYTPRYV